MWWPIKKVEKSDFFLSELDYVISTLRSGLRVFPLYFSPLLGPPTLSTNPPLDSTFLSVRIFAASTRLVFPPTLSSPPIRWSQNKTQLTLLLLPLAGRTLATIAVENPDDTVQRQRWIDTARLTGVRANTRRFSFFFFFF